MTPPSGPTEAQLPIHRQILQDYNETAVLLSFHASELDNKSSTTGKLPLTIFESIYEDKPDDGDKSMDIDGQQPSLTLKFRELPYTIETGEAEMIGVDSIARGGGNATAIPTNIPPSAAQKQFESQDKLTRKGKAAQKATTQAQQDEVDELYALSHEDEDCMFVQPSLFNDPSSLLMFIY